MLVVKAFHVVAIIAWMAGLLYIYRLFVYHVEETEEVVKARLEVWERKLWRAITVPAAWVAAILGVWQLVAQWDYFRTQPWMHTKLLLVVGMLAAHFYAGSLRKRLAAGLPVPSSRMLRLLNEVPTLLMIGIVLLVIVKPQFG